NEHRVVTLEQSLRLRVQLQRPALLVERAHALKQRLVQKYGVAVLGQPRRDLGLDFVQRRIGVGRREVVEDRGGAVEDGAGALHRDDGIGERRRFRRVRDGIDLLALLLHAGFEGGREVRVVDAIERRKLVRQRAGLEERVVVGGRRFGG